ncbi:MAG: DUF2339 domain-containing protein [Treponema sp.]|nr:DUF2339 domain-containing protein [Treponema sp.]
MTALVVLICAAFLFAVIGVIGLIAKTGTLSEENKRLSRRLNELTEIVSHLLQKQGVFRTSVQPAQTPVELYEPPIEPVPASIPPAVVAAPVEAGPPAETVFTEVVEQEPVNHDVIEVNLDTPAADENPPLLFEPIKKFIKSGNYWAAGGIILLLAGFATLITYLASRGFFTLEMGIIAAAASGLAMLTAGWLLRKKKPGFCLILQGGGIGLLYLSVFAAHKLIALFAQVTTLILLTALVPPAVSLALLQGSQALSFFGFLGGFAAPILISTGEGNHVFLFAFYTVLSLGVFAVSFFRFWRQLNILAFVCTFGSALYWTVSSYNQELFWTAQPFFLSYIVIFTALGIHCFGKKALKREAYFDGILLLGTPLAAAILQWRIFSFIPHGHAIVSVIFSAFYLGLAVFIWKRRGGAMRLFSESYLGLAVMMANLAVPLELAPGITSAVWAAEGVLFFFLGLRLKNPKVTVTALLLHIAAAIAFAVECLGEKTLAWNETFVYSGFLRSPAFTGALVVALAGAALLIITQKFRERNIEVKTGFFSENGIYHRAFLICLALWFYAWWYGGWFAEFYRTFPYSRQEFTHTYMEFFFLFCTITALAAFLSSMPLRCRPLLFALAPAVVLAFALAITGIFRGALGYYGGRQSLFAHNFFHGLYLWGWIAFFAVYTLVAVLSKKHLHEGVRATLVFILVLIAAAVFGSSLRALTIHFDLAPSWRSLAGLLPVFASMITITTVYRKINIDSYGKISSRILFFVLPLIFSLILGLWFLATIFRPGNPAPLPLYIPLINPLDLLEAFSITLFIFWQASLMKISADSPLQIKSLGRGALFVISDIALFLFISALLARAVHFYRNIPYDTLFGSDGFQLGLFIIWALYGIAHIAAGTKFARRKIWIAGAILTICDIVKLLLLDLKDAGTVIRIISFFAAGIVLLFIGWVSPLPPAAGKSAMEKQE